MQGHKGRNNSHQNNRVRTVGNICFLYTAVSANDVLFTWQCLKDLSGSSLNRRVNTNATKPLHSKKKTSSVVEVDYFVVRIRPWRRTMKGKWWRWRDWSIIWPLHWSKPHTDFVTFLLNDSSFMVSNLALYGVKRGSHVSVQCTAHLAELHAGSQVSNKPVWIIIPAHRWLQDVFPESSRALLWGGGSVKSEHGVFVILKQNQTRCLEKGSSTSDCLGLPRRRG